MSVLHLVTMPKWGLLMEEGTLVAWHRQQGETIAAGDDLIDAETTKITNTIEAPVTGTLHRLLAPTGATVACGTPLAVIGPATATAAEIDSFLAERPQGRREDAAALYTIAEPTTIAVDTGDGGTIRMRYLDTGSGDETIVLIHGFGGDLENWMFNQPVWARTHRVLALDLPGHGGSGKLVGDGSAAGLARIVGALIDAVAPGPIHIVAHSFGAIVARHVAQARPHRVRSFTGIAPADLGRVSRAYIDGFLGAKRRSDLTQATAMLFADKTLASRDMVEALLRYRRLDGVAQALAAIDAANLRADAADQAALAWWRDLGRRGLLIRGGRDEIVATDDALTGLVATERLEIATAGHMPQLETATAINVRVAEHIARHGATTSGAAA